MRVPQPDANVVKEVLGIDPLSLAKMENADNNQKNGEQYCMRVIAHRGAGYDYPENSIAAFKNSKDKGCSVEFDVSLTKDNIPIIFHDVTIERLTGQMGIVTEMTWDQLKDLDITYNHPLRDKFADGERIALFEDALNVCLNNEQRIFIDVKATGNEIVSVILDAFKKHPKLYHRAVVSSFNPITIYTIRKKDPNIVSSLAWRPHYFSRESYLGSEGLGAVRYHNLFMHIMACILDSVYEWALPRFVYYIVGISAILLHKDIIHQEIIQYWHERGIRVIAWSVNLPTEKLHFSKILKITYMTDTLLTEKI